jgi:nitroreductase
MDFNQKIQERYSCRKFKSAPIPDNLLRVILETARWAPSGLNNQPWAFIILKDVAIKEHVAQQTHYSAIIRNAPVCIAIFLDKEAGYNYVKDVQACGAVIEHILLASHNLGLGSVWLGEILNKREEVERILKVPPTWELMAVVALGYPDERPTSRSRKPLTELTFLNEFGNAFF